MDTNHDQQEDKNGRTEMEMELKKEMSDDGATNNYGSNVDEQLLWIVVSNKMFVYIVELQVVLVSTDCWARYDAVLCFF